MSLSSASPNFRRTRKTTISQRNEARMFHVFNQLCHTKWTYSQTRGVHWRPLECLNFSSPCTCNTEIDACKLASRSKLVTPRSLQQGAGPRLLVTRHPSSSMLFRTRHQYNSLKNQGILELSSKTRPRSSQDQAQVTSEA